MKKLDVDKAVELWTTGTAIKVIATRLGTTEKTLQKFMKGNEDYFPARKKKVKKSLTADQMDLAVKMWAEGYSLRAIGERIGKTKNAVSGLMSRNRDIFPERFGDLKKVAYSAKSIPKEVREKERVERASKLSSNAVRKMFHEALNPPPVTPPKPKEEALAYDQSRLPGYTLWELDEKGCKFAVNDGSPYRFCGETRYQMKPWCKAHHERVWRAN